MISLKKQLIFLCIISIILIITVIFYGCSSTDLGDPILYLICGYVVDDDSRLPLDSVKVTRFRDDHLPVHCITDSTGYYLFSPFGYYHDQFDIELHFEKGGYISKDTTVNITKQGEIIDSLIVYLN